MGVERSVKHALPSREDTKREVCWEERKSEQVESELTAELKFIWLPGLSGCSADCRDCRETRAGHHFTTFGSDGILLLVSRSLISASFDPGG